MSSIDNKPCCVWMDQFNEPSPADLRMNLGETDLALFDAFDSGMNALDGVSTRLQWYGEGWYWTIEYAHADIDTPLAVLIPAAEDVKVAVPIEPEFTSHISVSRLKRSIRDGLELGMEPFDANWAVWSLQPGTFIEDLVHLIRRRAKFLTTKTKSAD